MTRRAAAFFAALAVLSGCETVNDAFVRHGFTDHELSGTVREQILEGLEKRNQEPPKDLPRRKAPPFIDLG